ncbi:MAG: TIGR01777 family protein [Myxococcales bacterium]|nr:TIGR01777 family protein [Myxococcales bacterium]MCB9534457.1 TIGR01777 family protein [Myxococcales bacterium]
MTEGAAPARVVVTGATGFVGGALVAALAERGVPVTALVRSAARARQKLPSVVECVTIANDADVVAALDGAAGVVNLAGEPVAGRRWTDEYRQRLVDSRVGVTAALVESLGRCSSPPAVLVSCSAVGYYGDTGDKTVDESSPAGDDFLAGLCVRWEAAAGPAESLGVRVALPRLGVVLGPGGGALASMRPAFAIGVGGPVGSGRQGMPWVHLDDVVGALLLGLDNTAVRGPFNVTAPVSATATDLARVLGAAMRRPSLFPAPAAALRALFGDGAAPLLVSQRVRPTRLLDWGFEFRQTQLGPAVADAIARWPSG